MKAAFVTNRGARRQENQDAICVAGTVRTGDMTSPETLELDGYPQLLTVIDGMGGAAGVALAAGIIAETLSEAARAPEEGNFFGAELCIKTDEKLLGALFATAARKMASVVREAPEMAKMGAVAAGILMREKSALIFNCGDCRVYRVSGGGIERLTREHSIVQALYEKGMERGVLL